MGLPAPAGGTLHLVRRGSGSRLHTQSPGLMWLVAIHEAKPQRIEEGIRVMLSTTDIGIHPSNPWPACTNMPALAQPDAWQVPERRPWARWVRQGRDGRDKDRARASGTSAPWSRSHRLGLALSLWANFYPRSPFGVISASASQNSHPSLIQLTVPSAQPRGE